MTKKLVCLILLGLFLFPNNFVLAEEGGEETGVVEYYFSDPIDRVFGLAPGNYTYNISLSVEKGYNIFFATEAFSPNWDFNLTLEIWDSVGRYYHVVERKFGIAYGFPYDQSFETVFGAPRNGTYTLLVTLEVFTTLSLHLIAQTKDKVINEFYPESGVVGEVYEDLRVFNETIKVHDYVVPIDPDTEYSFNFVRVSPISEIVYQTHYIESLPQVDGTLEIGGLKFKLWDNITTAGNREENINFGVTLGSFVNESVKFTVDMRGIYTNMVFLFILHSTQRIGDGPDPEPEQNPTNGTVDDSIDQFFDQAGDVVLTTVFNDSFLLGAIIVLLIGGIVISIKSQTQIFEVE